MAVGKQDGEIGVPFRRVKIVAFLGVFVLAIVGVAVFIAVDSQSQEDLGDFGFGDRVPLTTAETSDEVLGAVVGHYEVVLRNGEPVGRDDVRDLGEVSPAQQSDVDEPFVDDGVGAVFEYVGPGMGALSYTFNDDFSFMVDFDQPPSLAGTFSAEKVSSYKVSEADEAFLDFFAQQEDSDTYWIVLNYEDSFGKEQFELFLSLAPEGDVVIYSPVFEELETVKRVR